MLKNSQTEIFFTQYYNYSDIEFLLNKSWSKIHICVKGTNHVIKIFDTCDIMSYNAENYNF